MIQVITVVALIVGLLVSLGNLCIMIYALSRFIKRPHTDLEQRVTEVETYCKELRESLRLGNDRFRRQDDINEMIFSVFLAFVDFEIAYCHNTGYEHDKDLLRAKELLEKHLAKGFSHESFS